MKNNGILLSFTVIRAATGNCASGTVGEGRRGRGHGCQRSEREGSISNILLFVVAAWEGGGRGGGGLGA